MKFMALVSTDDGRLTAGRVYVGTIVMNMGGWSNSPVRGELRVVVYDNKKQWMTFDPKVFAPGEAV